MAYHNERRDEAAKELAVLQKQVTDARASNRVLEETYQQRVREAREEALAQQEEARRLREEQEKEADAFRRKINEEAERLAKLRAQLDDTPEPVSPPAKVVYLPNPRSDGHVPAGVGFPGSAPAHRTGAASRRGGGQSALPLRGRFGYKFG